MPETEHWSISWRAHDGQLCAREPTAAEVVAAAAQLSSWYNEDHNRAMMSNEALMNSADVCEHYDKVSREGGRNFLLFFNGRLIGDADLRNINPPSGTAEFAILIGERQLQGRGFGTRFALILHALAFEKLRLQRLYVSIIPANYASLRLFEKLGYQRDNSPAARSYIDDENDITMSFGRDEFLRLHGDILPHLFMAG